MEKFFIGYLFVEFLRFYIDILRIYFTEDCIQSFHQLEFPVILKGLKTYLKITDFLYIIIFYYIQISDILYRYKVIIFVEGRQKFTIEEYISFDKFQKFICWKFILYYLDPDKQLFLQIDGFIEYSFNVIIYHLKEGYDWKPNISIFTIEIEPVIFFSRCFIESEQCYRSLELEIVYLI